MVERALPEVLEGYITVLEKHKQLTEKYKADLEQIEKVKAKMELWLLSQDKTVELTDIPESLYKASPYVFWHITPKSVEMSILAYRNIREGVTLSNGVAKKFEGEQNKGKDTIGTWLFAESKRTGLKSGKTEFGGYYQKLKTRASIADLDNLIKWAHENNASDIMYKQVNSTFVSSYYDAKLEEDKELAEAENREPVGEYPPYINVSAEYEIVVTK